MLTQGAVNGAACVMRLEINWVLLIDGSFGVQELIEGKSLAQMVEAGWQPAQKEVERIADELLTTFSYLQKEQVTYSNAEFC